MSENSDSEAEFAKLKATADSHYRSGEYREAIQTYTAALNITPNHIVHSNRSGCYFLLDQFSAALADAETCIKLDPSFNKGYLRKAVALAELGSTDKALQSLLPLLVKTKPDFSIAKDIHNCLQRIQFITSNPIQQSKNVSGNSSVDSDLLRAVSIGLKPTQPTENKSEEEFEIYSDEEEEISMLPAAQKVSNQEAIPIGIEKGELKAMTVRKKLKYGPDIWIIINMDKQLRSFATDTDFVAKVNTIIQNTRLATRKGFFQDPRIKQLREVMLNKLANSGGEPYITPSVKRAAVTYAVLTNHDILDRAARLLFHCEVNDLIRFLDKYNNQFDINAENKYGETLLCMACRRGVIKVVQYLLKHPHIDIDIDYKKMKPLDWALSQGHWHIAQILTFHKLNLETRKKVETFEDKRNFQNGIAQTFEEYLGKRCGIGSDDFDDGSDDSGNDAKEKYDNYLSMTEDVIIDLINDQKSFSPDLFVLVWHYNEDKMAAEGKSMKDSRIWKALQKQIERILDVNSVSTNKVGWSWFSNNLLNSTIWLDSVESLKADDADGSDDDSDAKTIEEAIADGVQVAVAETGRFFRGLVSTAKDAHNKWKETRIGAVSSTTNKRIYGKARRAFERTGGDRLVRGGTEFQSKMFSPAFFANIFEDEDPDDDMQKDAMAAAAAAECTPQAKIKPKVTFFSELISTVDNELSKQREEVSREMRTLIQKHHAEWRKIVNYQYTTLVYPKDHHRQDKIPDGLLPDYDQRTLQLQTILARSSQFDAERMYSTQCYLSELIIRAHTLNSEFHTSLRAIFDNTFGQEDSVVLQAGPVKTLARCQAKAEMDYRSSEFPTSASVIDIIRASITFVDLKSYYDGLMMLVKHIKSGNDPCIKDIVRVKNGFCNDDFRLRQMVPKTYKDIKLNVVVSKDGQSVIGEIQLLLKPILAMKKQNHELYEIKRIRAFWETIQQMAELDDDIERVLNVAISNNNHRKVSDLIVSHSTELSTMVDLNHQNQDGETMLMRAIAVGMKHRSYVVARLLLEFFKDSIDWTIKDSDGLNYMHYIGGCITDPETLILFLHYMPVQTQLNLMQVDNTNPDTPSPFFMSLQTQRSLKVVRHFLKKFGRLIDLNDVDSKQRSLLSFACVNKWDGADSILDTLIRRMTPSAVRNFINMKQNDSDDNKGARKPNRTPIMIAIEHRSLSALKYLVSNFGDSIDWTLKDDQGKTVLHIACENHKPNSLRMLHFVCDAVSDELLLQFIVTPEMYKKCKTPLMTAIENGNIKMIRFLIAKFADQIRESYNLLDKKGMNIERYLKQRQYELEDMTDILELFERLCKPIE